MSNNDNGYLVRTAEIARDITIAVVNSPSFKLTGDEKEQISFIQDIYKSIYNIVKTTN